MQHIFLIFLGFCDFFDFFVFGFVKKSRFFYCDIASEEKAALWLPQLAASVLALSDHFLELRVIKNFAGAVGSTR